MRITASWLDPTVGSTEYKDVAHDLRCHPWAGSPQIVTLLAALRRAVATDCAVSPTRPSLPPCSGPSRSGLEMAARK